MRCFNKKAVHQQHLQEEVKWLQQMLSKEQQSKQAVLGQLQDERAKCALLELEILHAAQAAQEMGESLCLFFNPCYQQSEQQAVQQGQAQYSNEGVLQVEGDEPPCARTLFQQPQQKQRQQQQQDQHDELQMAQLLGTDPLINPYPTKQEQQRQARRNSLDLQSEQMVQEGRPYSAAATAAAAAAEAESKQDDPPSDPDTAAHDQTPTKLRESAVLLASTDQWPTNSEARLNSPRRSLKLGSPGRKSSPRRLARNSPCRSLRVSNSSPMKPPAAAAAAGGGGGGGVVASSSSADQQQQEQQQQLQLCANKQKDVPCVADACVTGSVLDAGTNVTAGAAATADVSATAAPPPATQLAAHPGAAEAAAAAVPATGSVNLAQTRGNNSRSTFSAAAAAAAAVQQSLSAASAAIAAAEALRGQSRVSTARSMPEEPQGSMHAPAATAAAAAAAQRTLPGSMLAHAAAPTVAQSVVDPLQLPATTSVDETAAAAEGNSLPVTSYKRGFTVSRVGSGFDSKSSSSSDSAWGEPTHKLPASIVAQPLGPDSDTAHAGSPGEAATSRVAVVVGASTNTQPQQQQQEEEAEMTNGSAAAAAAAAVGADLWQPEHLRSQPVSVLVSSLARQSRGGSSRSSSSNSGKGSAAFSLAESGSGEGKQTTSSTSSASSTACGTEKLALYAAEVCAEQQQQQLRVLQSDAAALPSAGHPGTAAGPAAQTDAAGQPAAVVPAAADSTASAVADAEPAATNAATQDAATAAAAGSAEAPVADSGGSNAHSEAAAAAAASDNMTGIPVRKSTHRKPPLAPVPQSRGQTQAAQGPGLRTSTRQTQRISSSAAAAAAGAGAGATVMHTQRVSRAYGSQQQPVAPSRLQQQQQQQQGMRSGTASGAPGPHSPLKSAVAVIVGPMHAAAFGPALAQQQTSANNSSSCSISNSSGTRPDCVCDNAGMRMQLTDQRGLPAAAVTVDAADVRQLAPRPLYSSKSSRAAECQRQPQPSSSLRKTATHAAAAAAGHAAVPSRYIHTATAAAQTTADLERCDQAVCAPADCASSSCLSPLHWHQSNLGSSRSDFHQAMMLAACSNPNSVMRQQLAFDQQDSKSVGRSAAGRYIGSRGGGSSRGFWSGKGQRAAVSKPRKGWLALF